MIPLQEIEALVDTGIALLGRKKVSFRENDTVYVPHMELSGVVNRVIGKQVDVMLDNRVFIQTSEAKVELAGNTTIKEENNQFPLNERSNRSQNQSSASENNVTIKKKQLSLF